MVLLALLKSKSTIFVHTPAELRMAPTEWEILGTNEPITTMDDNADTLTSIRWNKLAHMLNITWSTCNTVVVTMIPSENVDAYFSYGIRAIATSDPKNYTSLARVKMWEQVWEPCFA